MDPPGGTCHCSPSYLIRSIPPVEGLENNAKKQCGVGPVVDGDPIGPRQLIVQRCLPKWPWSKLTLGAVRDGLIEDRQINLFLQREDL